MSNVVPFPSKPRIVVAGYFGGCPTCGLNDGCFSIGRDHWFVCHQHKTKWWIGSNLFSSWRELTEEEHTRNYYRLCDYREVEPLPQNVGLFR